MSVRGFNTGSGIEQYDYDYLDNKPAVPTKASIGLGNVDNTSDMDKPVSIAQGNALSQKVDKVPGMGLSQEDYTSADKAKLDALPTNAELEADLAGKASAETVAALESAVNDPDNGLATKASAIINTASGAIASFSDGADSMPVKKLVVAVEPVQTGTGDPSPENIRPISGWTGAEIEGTGINIWNEQWESGSISSETGQDIANPNIIRTKGYISVKPGTVYAVVKSASSAHGIAFYDANKAFVSYRILGSSELYVRFAPPDNCYYVRFRCVSAYGTTYNHDISINYPATDTSYHAYTGSKISVTFPTEAGTVYGATLTVNPDRTGALVVDRKILTAPTVNSVQQGSTGIYSASVSASQFAGKNADKLMSNKYKSVTAIVQPGDTGIRNTTGGVYIYDDAFAGKTGAEATEMLADLQIVYSLATPITYALTASEIDGILTTLYGTNNIWADCGDSTVEYTADTKLYIEQLTQPTEDDMTADHAISAGTFFMIGNNLYLATSQIAAGATITPGTNATQLSLADALNQLNA